MGLPHEAMVDMTGGVAEVLKINGPTKDLLALLRHLLAKGALINCANCQVRWHEPLRPAGKHRSRTRSH